MEYGGIDKRKTKKDLKRKRIARGYKRGGKFRSSEANEFEVKEKENLALDDSKPKKGKKKR